VIGVEQHSAPAGQSACVRQARRKPSAQSSGAAQTWVTVFISSWLVTNKQQISPGSGKGTGKLRMEIGHARG